MARKTGFPEDTFKRCLAHVCHNQDAEERNNAFTKLSTLLDGMNMNIIDACTQVFGAGADQSLRNELALAKEMLDKARQEIAALRDQRATKGDRTTATRDFLRVVYG